MCSPLGPTLDNVFLELSEKNWLQNCPSDSMPYYYCHVDDTSVLFTSPKHLEAFRNFLTGSDIF